MSKHTPGPWAVYHGGESEYLIATEKNGPRILIGCTYGVDVDERANARLIAAAPELLASIEHAARYLRESLSEETKRENVEPEAQMLKDFECVIAKAAGGAK